MNFKDSSQRQRWLFTADELAEIRQQNRIRSLDAIHKEGGRYVADGDEETSDAADAGRIQPPSPEEELLLLKHYQATIQHMCQELRFPRKVLGTSVQYLRRFYLSNSTLDHDPQHIVVTCLYLACKIEDCYISAAELSRLTGLPQDLLLRSELVLLEGLKFDFIVFSPYRAIDAFFEDIAGCRRNAAAENSSGCTPSGFHTDANSLDDGILAMSEESLTQAKKSACAAADALLLTDAPLLYTPGQLALAACRSGLSKVGVKGLPKLMSRVAQQAQTSGEENCSSGGNASSMADAADLQLRLQRSLPALDLLGAEGAKKPVKEEIKTIDGRLKACRALLLDPNSGAAKATAAAKAKARADKQQRKAEKLRQQMAARMASVGVMGDLPQVPKPGASQQPDIDDSFADEQPPAKKARPSMH